MCATFRFHQLGPLGRVGLRVAMSVCLSVCLFVCLCVCAIECSFFRGLSLALRSHDQIPASDWSTLLPYHMVVVVVVVVVGGAGDLKAKLFATCF